MRQYNRFVLELLRDLHHDSERRDDVFEVDSHQYVCCVLVPYIDQALAHVVDLIVEHFGI